MSTSSLDSPIAIAVNSRFYKYTKPSLRIAHRAQNTIMIQRFKHRLTLVIEN